MKNIWKNKTKYIFSLLKKKQDVTSLKILYYYLQPDSSSSLDITTTLSLVFIFPVLSGIELISKVELTALRPFQS